MLLFAEGPIFVVEQTEVLLQTGTFDCCAPPNPGQGCSFLASCYSPSLEASWCSVCHSPFPPNVSLRSVKIDAGQEPPVVVMGSSCVLYYLPGANCLRDPCMSAAAVPVPFYR